MSKTDIKCPHCGSEKGYYLLERVHRYLMFDTSGNATGATEDVSDHTGKRIYCRGCQKALPRKTTEELLGAIKNH